mmetsp:Transcript_16344/g.26861  ORF Transcript_16344/g.26861 Transcript_16344/m.26861 type:complete len:202 (-) Transcript_16344:173-778(-)
MTMNSALLLAITIYCALSSSSHVYSFSLSPGRQLLQGGRLSTTSQSSPCRTISNCRTPTHLFNDKQAEIAALEERLRQLKAEEESGATTEQTTEQQRQQIMADAAEKLTADEMAALEKINEESDDSIMFSEKWKEGDDGAVDGEGIMGTVKTAALVLGFVVFLGLFSQVPVGESDLQRYQDIKGSSSRIDLGDLNPGVTVQ